VHIAARAHRGGRLEDVDRALRVDALEGGADRRVLADDADQVDHGVAAGHPLGQRLPCHHVALDALDRPQAVQLALRAPADQAADRASSRPQGLDDRPAHEAGAARDEHPSHRRLHGP